MVSTIQILHVAVPSPLHTTFDYLPPEGELPQEGVRVRVNFGHRKLVGLVVSRETKSRVCRSRLKRVIEVLDSQPLFDVSMLELLRWSSAYYHHPLGEVVMSALPSRLRRGCANAIEAEVLWVMTNAGDAQTLKHLSRAPRQQALLQVLRQHPQGLRNSDLNRIQKGWRQAMRALSDKGLVRQSRASCLPQHKTREGRVPPLNPQQAQVVESVLERMAGFAPMLLDGVTGSGKTEVYLKLAQSVIERGSQVLVLVPEISLTPQLVSRFRNRLSASIAVIHSGLSECQRHCAWQTAGRGEAGVVIGTRSAVFTPLLSPALIIVDEEHDSSFKQQDGFRYNARDLAVFRARQHAVPVLLASATPSLESLLNVQRQRYHYLSLPERAGRSQLPRLDVIDIRHQETKGGMSQALLTQIYEHLETGAQVLLFLNRRGFAPVLLCHQCGWAVSCERCDAHMTVHAGDRALRCHHCGAERALPSSCPECGSLDLRGLGEGTERLEQELRRRFADISIVRIDRDTTRRRGEMQSKLDQIHRGEHRILIGTQMLSKGHDFPHVTLVCIVNADHGFFSTDFRAAERMAQLIVQVAGRAGRGDRLGKVVLQTHQPEHPLLQLLLSGGYSAFAKAALKERRICGLPPYGYMAVLRAESPRPETSRSFLERVRRAIKAQLSGELSVLGPAPPPMERRAGLYRMHLLVTARQRRSLSRLLNEWIVELDSMQGARKVRWSLDVDPVDLG